MLGLIGTLGGKKVASREGCDGSRIPINKENAGLTKSVSCGREPTGTIQYDACGRGKITCSTFGCQHPDYGKACPQQPGVVIESGKEGRFKIAKIPNFPDLGKLSDVGLLILILKVHSSFQRVFPKDGFGIHPMMSTGTSDRRDCEPVMRNVQYDAFKAAKKYSDTILPLLMAFSVRGSMKEVAEILKKAFPVQQEPIAPPPPQKKGSVGEQNVFDDPAPTTKKEAIIGWAMHMYADSSACAGMQYTKPWNFYHLIDPYMREFEAKLFGTASQVGTSVWAEGKNLLADAKSLFVATKKYNANTDLNAKTLADWIDVNSLEYKVVLNVLTISYDNKKFITDLAEKMSGFIASRGVSSRSGGFYLPSKEWARIQKLADKGVRLGDQVTSGMVKFAGKLNDYQYAFKMAQPPGGTLVNVIDVNPYLNPKTYLAGLGSLRSVSSVAPWIFLGVAAWLIMRKK